MSESLKVDLPWDPLQDETKKMDYLPALMKKRIRTYNGTLGGWSGLADLNCWFFLFSWPTPVSMVLFWGPPLSLIGNYVFGPPLSTCIKSVLTACPDSALFLNKPIHQRLLQESSGHQREWPFQGQGIFLRLIKIKDGHYDFGELYMEFIHGNCINSTNYAKIS